MKYLEVLKMHESAIVKMFSAYQIDSEPTEETLLDALQNVECFKQDLEHCIGCEIVIDETTIVLKPTTKKVVTKK
jgi:hypothetical protein